MDYKYYLKPPNEQLFYKIIATMMTLACLNAEQWSWYIMPKNFIVQAQRYLVYYLVPIVTMLEVVYLILKYKELQFNTLSMVFTVLPVSLMVLLKLCVAQTQNYRTAMKDLMSKIHLHHYYVVDRQTYVKEILISVEKISRWTYLYYVSLCIICCSAFEIVPIVHNLQNLKSINNITVRLEIIIHMWLPIDYEFNFYYWVIVQIGMFYCGLVAMLIIPFFDCLNLVFIYHLIGHIKILKHRIYTSFHKDMSQEEVKKNLIETSRNYTFLTKTIYDVEAAFGLNVAGIYLHNLISGGLFIYQFMTSDTYTETLLTYGLMIPIYMGILLIMSLTLEDMRIEADDIPELVYGIHWERMSISNQKLVLMILFQVQPILEFKAAFNIKTGMQPAMSILKTTFSFYVMMKARM